MCNLELHANNAKNLSNYYNRHARIHGFANAKEMERKATVSHFGAPPPSHAPMSPGFGGGFEAEWEDRGANDERFADVLEEDGKLTLAEWVASPAVRQLLTECEDVWLAGAGRVRHSTQHETMMTALYSTKHAVDMLLAVENPVRCLSVPADQTELLTQSPREVLHALGDLVPPSRWLQRIVEHKSLGSAIKSVKMLQRLMAWAVPCEMSRLAPLLGNGDHFPEDVVRARGWLPLVEPVLVSARKQSLLQVRAGKLQQSGLTDTWTKLADEVASLAQFKVQAMEALKDGLEEVKEYTLEEIRSVALLVLIGYAELPALRSSVGHSRAADLDKHHELVDKLSTLTLYRLDGKLALKVVGNQKHHLMQPYAIDKAPFAASFLGALLDHANFVHGGMIVDEEEESLLTEIQAAADMLEIDEVPATLRYENQNGAGHNGNVMRRWYASMAYLAVLWQMITVKQFVAICYVQQHEPKTVFEKYVKLAGLSKLMPAAADQVRSDVLRAWAELTARDGSGLLTAAQHNKLIGLMWSALDVLHEMSKKLAQEKCPKCKGDEADGEHLAVCLGQLSVQQAADKVREEKSQLLESKAAEADDVVVLLSEEESESLPPLRSKRSAAKAAAGRINKMTRTSSRVAGGFVVKGDDEEAFEEGDELEEEAQEGDEEESEEEQAAEEAEAEAPAGVPAEALEQFEELSRFEEHEVLALLVVVGGEFRLWLFKQDCSGVQCEMNEDGNNQMIQKFEETKPKVVAWVHSHPDHDQYMSHIDVHNQATKQEEFPGVVALVFAPDKEEEWAAYVVNEVEVVKECARLAPATLGEPCRIEEKGKLVFVHRQLYSRVPLKVNSAKCLVEDMR